jgi:Cd2+/Zn2+-exporting ATPase
MDLLQELMAAGFTEYEAKVYLALLRDNPATGYQLSKDAGIPRSMVYEALGRLDVRGAVLRTEDRRATLYRPVPPDILLDRYQKEHQELIASLRKSLNAVFSSQQEDYFWSIQGRGSVQSYALQMVESAQQNLWLVLSDTDLESLRSRLVDAEQRGVEISALLTGEGELDCGEVRRHPTRESEAQQLTNMLVLVVDDRQVLIANTDLETTATITSNTNLVLIARQFVWMELFAQRVYAGLGEDLLIKLDPQDRQLLEGYTRPPA